VDVSRSRFSDECTAVLETLAKCDDGMDADAIAAETEMPVVQVVDMISNYLGKSVESFVARPMGRKVTLYRLKER
jgi:hypothetical protein